MKKGICFFAIAIGILMLTASVPVMAAAAQPTAIHPNKFFLTNPVVTRGQKETTWGFTLVNAKTGMQIAPLPKGTVFLILVDGGYRVGKVTPIKYGTQSVSWTLSKADSYKCGKPGSTHKLTVFFWDSPQYGYAKFPYQPCEWIGSYSVAK